MPDGFVMPTDEQIQAARELYDRIANTEKPVLALKLFPEGEGRPPCYWAPDPKGTKILLPLSFRNSERVRYLDGTDGHAYAARGYLGQKGAAYAVRIVTDLAGILIHLPTDPGARSFICWYDDVAVEADYQRKLVETRLCHT